MKQLQINFTTPEQSKRLMELGLPADSADCYYRDFASSRVRLIPNVREMDDKFGIDTNFLIPCWSVGRLIEIYNICVNNMPGMQLDFGNAESCTYIELIVSSFELAADDGLLDFSKLEE